jgi:uncharacterized OB-fold protein
MPKPSPIPDEVSKPFWDACNERRLIIQTCAQCDRMQYPPEKTCIACGSSAHLTWREVKGMGRIHGYCVMHDSRVKLLQERQPFNIAVIELEENPQIKFFSHLPGTPPDEVPVGAPVKVEFEATFNGQLVPEWRVVQ